MNTNNLTNLFRDCYKIIFTFLIYFISLILPVSVLKIFIKIDSLWLNLFGIFVSIVIFMVIFSLEIIIFYRFATIGLKEGKYNIKSKECIQWGLGNFIIVTMESSFVKKVIETFSFLSWAFYNLMGAKFPYSTILGSGIMILDPKFVEIGENSTIGTSSLILSHQGEGEYIILKKVKIGKNTTIGTKSEVLAGAVISDNAILGSCSLLTKDKVMPDGEIWGGVPAKKIEEA